MNFASHSIVIHLEIDVMKKIFALLLLTLAGFRLFGQCNMVAISVSASDTDYVQLYHAGLFLIASGNDNVCEWHITDMAGKTIHRDTTKGDFKTQSFMYFDHSVPLTDSMKVELAIINTTEGITCTISDTLYWQETKVQNSFIGNWEVLHSNSGSEQKLNSTHNLAFQAGNIVVYPSPIHDHFQIEGNQKAYSINIFDAYGKLRKQIHSVENENRVDVTDLSSGVYVAQIRKTDGTGYVHIQIFKN